MHRWFDLQNQIASLFIEVGDQRSTRSRGNWSLRADQDSERLRQSLQAATIGRTV